MVEEKKKDQALGRGGSTQKSNYQTKEGEIRLVAGTCEIIISKDQRGRPVLTPLCPPDGNGEPVVSQEVKTLSDAFHTPEVVLRPPRVVKENGEFFDID